MFTNYYIGVRLLADTIGVDPWDVSMPNLRKFVRQYENVPKSRYWFGSPCRFVRSIDIIVHVWLPDAISERYPMQACYLRSTSPRWGSTWREW